VQIDGSIIHRRTNRFGQLIVADEGPKRSLYLDGNTLQSCMYLRQPHVLVMDYSHAMMCALLFNDTPARVLLVALGGASLVKFLLHACPQVAIEVAEINPAVIAAARNFFYLPVDFEKVKIFEQAGEELVREKLQEGEAYDLVLLDAFDDRGPARALLRPEFLHDCRELLRQNGIFAMNLWNRPQDRFPEMYAVITTCFDGSTLKLQLAESYRNAIAFGFRTPIRPRELQQLKPLAKKLGKRTGINFSKYLRTLYWQNFS